MPKSPRRTVRLDCESLEGRAVPAFLAPVTSNGSFVQVGDFNNDGKADLVLVDIAADTASIRLGNGAGTFQPAGKSQRIKGMESGIGVSVADFDADGKPDVLISQSNDLVLLRGTGNGALQAPKTQVLSDLTSARVLAATDMNGDGRADLVLHGSKTSTSRGVVTGSATYVRVMLADPGPSFRQVSSTLIAQAGRMGAPMMTAPDVNVGDIDGDGDIDVLTVANAGTKPYPSRILSNDGTGSLVVGANVTGFDGAQVTLMDLDGDRKADILRDNTDGTWTVFLGTGDGSYTRRETVALPKRPVVADVNRDGHRDLIAVDSAGGTVKVSLGNGNGTFQPPRTFAAGPGPIGTLYVGDFNGDGRADLALNVGTSKTSVLLNSGAW